VYGFASRILHHFTSPTGLLMLTYPMHTETHNLRKHKRVDCYFPAHAVHANQNFHGLILNVSMGGCKVLLDMDRHYGNEHFRDGDEIHLDFYVLERIHTYSVRARVIHAEMEGDKLALGLMFLEDEDKIRRIVADYISEVSRALGL
jgi:c-di-GMP-binding flagellar brake protein YcgR